MVENIVATDKAIQQQYLCNTLIFKLLKKYPVVLSMETFKIVNRLFIDTKHSMINYHRQIRKCLFGVRVIDLSVYLALG